MSQSRDRDLKYTFLLQYSNAIWVLLFGSRHLWYASVLVGILSNSLPLLSFHSLAELKYSTNGKMNFSSEPLAFSIVCSHFVTLFCIGFLPANFVLPPSFSTVRVYFNVSLSHTMWHDTAHGYWGISGVSTAFFNILWFVLSKISLSEMLRTKRLGKYFL